MNFVHFISYFLIFFTLKEGENINTINRRVTLIHCIYIILLEFFQLL